MNRIGMIVDVSHISDKAFYQVIELSKTPVVATHSCCRHFTPGWERNMSDAMIRLLARHGGLIQINFGSIFVNTEVNRRFVGNTGRGEPQAKASIADVVANINHVVQLVGIDHVGLGSDFDGVSRLPEGLQDVSCYPNLIRALLEAGYCEADIRKICGGNFLRVWSVIQNAAENRASS
jgi:membrane dipeptidase